MRLYALAGRNENRKCRGLMAAFHTSDDVHSIPGACMPLREMGHAYTTSTLHTSYNITRCDIALKIRIINRPWRERVLAANVYKRLHRLLCDFVEQLYFLERLLLCETIWASELLACSMSTNNSQTHSNYNGSRTICPALTSGSAGCFVNHLCFMQWRLPCETTLLSELSASSMSPERERIIVKHVGPPRYTCM